MTGEGRSTLAGAALGAAFAAAHGVMTAWMRAPIVQPDELGYVDNARHLALGGIRPVTGYYPGLSALITPLWKFSQDPLTVWRYTLWLNCGLCGLTTFVIWLLVPRLSDTPVSTARRVLVTVAISSYPALVLYSNVSMAESLFELGAATVTLMAFWAFGSMGARRTRRNPIPWIVLGLTVGLLVAVHPRGLAVVIAVLIVAGLGLQPWAKTTARSRPASWMRLAALGAGLIIGLAITRVGLVLVRPATGTALGNYRADAVFGKAFGGGAARLLGIGIAGQILYLTVATAGLAPLGAVIGIYDLGALIRRRVSFSPAVATRAFAGLAALGVLGMSVLFLNGGDRADQIIYGRYNEGCVVALLVIGMTWVLNGSVRRIGVWLLVGAAGLGIGALALVVGLTPGLRRAVINVETVLAIESVIRRSGPYLNVAAIALAGVAFLVGAVLIALRFPRVAVFLVGAVFLAASLDTFTGFVARGSRARSRQDVIASTILLASSQLHIPKSCIGWDAGLNFSYFQNKFLLPGWKVDIFDGSSGQPPCGSFVVSNRPDFFSHYRGSQIVTLENDLTMILFVLPGPTQQRLQDAGWLLPADVPGALPLDRQMASVTATAPRSVRSGSSARASVVAANIATHGNPWPNERGLRQGPDAVRVTARWFRPDQDAAGPGEPGDNPLATSVIELPRTLLPGQRVHLSLPLIARTASGAGLPPGSYEVVVAVYQELVGTLPGGVITLPITVT